jgi:hypothetical protein
MGKMSNELTDCEKHTCAPLCQLQLVLQHQFTTLYMALPAGGLLDKSNDDLGQTCHACIDKYCLDIQESDMSEEGKVACSHHDEFHTLIIN